MKVLKSILSSIGTISLFGKPLLVESIMKDYPNVYILMIMKQ